MKRNKSYSVRFVTYASMIYIHFRNILLHITQESTPLMVIVMEKITAIKTKHVK